ncbi:hypothetical protein Tco_0270890 [Tanacetum coccineum]
MEGVLMFRYHDNAFVTSRALHIVNELNASATYHLLDAFFKNQEQFYNAQTLNMSREAVLDQVIGLASSTLGNSLKSTLTSGFKDSKTGTRTSVSFKVIYLCFVSYTNAETVLPQFMIIHELHL